MASFNQTFDASSIEPDIGYEVLPPGKYLAQITASEMRLTREGDGQYLFLELDILDGPYMGRKLFDRLNLINSNPDTVHYAQRTLSAICRAVGKLQVNNSEQLHLMPMTLDVRVRPPKGQYGESNSIRYQPRQSMEAWSVSPGAENGGRLATPSGVASVGASDTSASAAGGLPWKRRL